MTQTASGTLAGTPDTSRVRGALSRLTSAGNTGFLPVMVALIAVACVFQFENANFLSPANITNLLLQVTAIGTIALGIFLVMLLGEIDLSAGSLSGLAGAVMAVLVVRHGVGQTTAIVAAVLVGGLVGLIHGVGMSVTKVPAFVVTLAGLIAWQGAQLWVLGPDGSINIPNGPIPSLTGTLLSPAASWTAALLLLAAFLGTRVVRRQTMAAHDLPVHPIGYELILWAIAAAGIVAVTVVLNSARGVPLAFLIFLGLSISVDFVVRATPFGRHVLAVGGNAEAARRAGISLDRTRILVFIAAGCFAAFGGVLAASRLLSVSQSSGGGDTLLMAIAAVVIGGTSLFGGRGSAYSAVLGILVIGAISNGMDLLGLNSSVKFVITGVVLFLAVAIDALLRNRGVTNRR